MLDKTPSSSAAGSSRLAVLLHDLRGGGAERVSLNLVRGMVEAGREVDLVLVRAQGKYLDLIPPGARVVDLDKSNVFKAIPALARYLRRERPKAVLSGLTHMNVAVLIAKLLARGRTRVAVTEHNQISLKAAKAEGLRGRLIYRLVPALYPFADDVIAVSNGVAADVETFSGLKSGTVRCVYNPVYDQSLSDAAAKPVDHPWLQPGQPPVLLAAGRLHEQKGFDVLLRALQIVLRTTSCRLIVMGEGELRPKLEALVAELGLTEHVSLIGFVENPYAMMSRAGAFVLSSRWEGLPTVLIEALACGAPVVSTDCPSGPDEILEGGRYGVLVPVENPEALAAGIVQALGAKRGEGLARAQEFSVTASSNAYLALLERA